MLFVIIICYVSGLPIVKGKEEDLTYVEGSPTYVSKLGSDGDDTTLCGSQSLPCGTFARGVTRAFEETDEEDIAEVVIDVGVFMETEQINLTRGLNIAGVDQTACFLTLPHDPYIYSDHCLFWVEISETPWLRFFNITILLANKFLQTYYNCFDNCNADYALIFQQCCITRESNIVDATYSIRVSYMSVKFDSCTVYNSTTTTDAALPFFYSEVMYKLCVTNSSFANINVNIIPRTSNWLQTANGGCFRVNDVENFTLSQCVFVACSCGDSFRSVQKGGHGAVGYISDVDEGLIRSCVFSNTSAIGGFGGAIYFQYVDILNIEDTSCIRCHSDHGGAFRFTRILNLSIYNCSFTNCFSNSTDGRGGALFVDLDSVVVIRHCTFANCMADFGGGLYVEYNSNVNVEDSVWIGNSAVNGNDIYGQSNSIVTFNSEVPSYTDQSSDASVYCIKNEYDEYDLTECGLMLEFIGYSGTCSGTYISDRCDVPCAANRITKTCVKLNACPEGYFPILGVCEPVCLYFDASGSGGRFACTSQCVYDDSLKYPLCASGVVPCAERTMNASALLPCWSVDCYWDQGNAEPNKCIEEETDCTNKNHFTKEGPINYTCSLLDCDLRTANSSEKWPCGKATGESPSCFQDIGGPEQNACVTSCTNANHYENMSTGEGSATDTGKCTALPCEGRTKNEAGDSPCGPECYVNLVDSGGSDCTRCLNEKLHEKEPNGTCSWKPCPSREADESMGDFPCGPDACYADSNRNGECHPDCALSAHYEENNVTGRCELKACTKRKGNTSDGGVQQQLPCGTDDCFLDLSLDPSGATCGAECFNSTYYTENNIAGRCERKDCAVGIGPLLCDTAPWCVVTEETPRECLETCRNPTLFTVSPEEDVTASTYRTCIPKTCTDIGLAHCTQAVWCVVTETGDAASACSENCSDPLNFEVSKERDPKNPLYGRCMRKEQPNPEKSESQSSFSKGQIVGLIVGVGVAVMVVAVGAVAVGVYLVQRRKKMDNGIQENLSVNSEPPSVSSDSSKSDVLLRQRQQEIQNEESQ